MTRHAAAAPALDPEQAQLGPSMDGTVVLDIGGDIGALVLHAPASMHLDEIEVSLTAAPEPAGSASHEHLHHDHSHGGDSHDGHSHAHPARTHVAIRERRGPSGVRYAAIYPSLRAGEYTVWGLDGEPADTVRIVGGEVAELDWR